MKRNIYTVLISLMLFFMVVPFSLGATTETYNPMEYLTDEEQAYVKEMRGAIDKARNAIADAKGDLIPYFPEGYEKWAQGLVGKFGVVNASIAAMGSIAAPSEFSAVQAQAKTIEGYNVNWIASSINPMFMVQDLAYAVQTFSGMESSLNNIRGEVEAVSGTLEKTVAEVAKKQKMGADILDSLLSCEETAT